MEVAPNMLRVAYKGSGSSDSEASCIRSNVAIPTALPWFYFECTVISKGRDGYVSIGVCAGSCSLNKLPGWDRHSFGYHGDDGCKFVESGSGTPFGPTFSTGDTVGLLWCCLDRTVSFTKNGTFLGTAVRVAEAEEKLFCCVGMRTPGEILEANFGSLPFVFKLESYISIAIRDMVHRQLDQLFPLRPPKASPLRQMPPLPLPSPHQQQQQLQQQSPGSAAESSSWSLRTVIHKVILSELCHRGYLKTAKEFAAAIAGGDQSQSQLSVRDEEDILFRRSVRERIIQGDTESVLRDLDARSAELGWVIPREIRALLYSQHFIELVRSRNLVDCLAFGKWHVADLQQTGVFCLLTFADPLEEKSVAGLMSVERRCSVADAMNAAIASPRHPSLEIMTRQWLLCCRLLAAGATGTGTGTPNALLGQMMANSLLLGSRQ